MFRPIRNRKNEISAEAAKKLLAAARRGVLAMCGDDGYPYAVPINYRYCESENRIYFHGAHAGYKAELLKKDGKVCFTVYGNEAVKDEAWAPYVQSVVVFGRCTPVTDRTRTIELVRKFAEKYYPNTELIEREIAVSGKAVQMFEIEIEHLSGKEVQEK